MRGILREEPHFSNFDIPKHRSGTPDPFSNFRILIVGISHIYLSCPRTCLSKDIITSVWFKPPARMKSTFSCIRLHPFHKADVLAKFGVTMDNLLHACPRLECLSYPLKEINSLISGILTPERCIVI